MLCILCFFVLLGALFFAKSTLVTYRFHLDPWVIEPLWKLLESNLAREESVMFPWLWLRLFYIETVIYTLITGVSYSALTKYWFILLSSLFVFCLAVLIRSRFRAMKHKAVIILLFLLLLLQNDFFVRRLSMTVRENYALIAFIAYFLLYYKSWFTHPLLSGLLSGVIYGSNPITSFMLLAVNGIYGLYWIIKKDIARFRERAKQFLRWIVLWSYFFIEFIKSLIWQYYHVETEVVAKNPFAYDFYYITFKHINIFLVIVLFVAILMYLYQRHHKKQSAYRGELIMFSTLLAVYLLAFLPQVGLYQDRLVMYISIFSFLFLIPYLYQLKSKFLLMAMSVYAIISIGTKSDYQYYSPFDNTQLDLPAYDMFATYTWEVLVFKFDEYVLRKTNPFLVRNQLLEEKFAAIQHKEELVEFLAKNKFVLFVTKATMWQDDRYYDLPAIKMLTAEGKITTLADGNFLYIHTGELLLE